MQNHKGVNMRMVSIKIQSLAERNQVLFPELTEKPLQIGSLGNVGILESGMQSGKTSVALIVTLADGSNVLAELSAGQFWQIACAVNGGAARFGEELT